MACGTGKTFTSLKIAEQEAGAGGLVLFLAPSIALVGQTLREWVAECSVSIFPICICSDSRVGRLKQKKTEDEDIVSITDLAYPASTDVATIRERLAVAARDLTSSPCLRRGIPYCVADLAVSRFDGFLLLDGLCRLT